MSDKRRDENNDVHVPLVSRHRRRITRRISRVQKVGLEMYCTWMHFRKSCLNTSITNKFKQRNLCCENGATDANAKEG